MAPDFGTLLATEIINEQKTLSYRNVSRALKVHVNAAKCMLYEFHQRENKKRPGSVYATYLISGVKINPSITVTTKESAPVLNGSDMPVKIDGDEDTEMGMPSSPPPFPSSMPSVSFAASQKVQQAALPERLQIPIRTVSLVREEDLEKVRAQYEKVTSIHVYSLSPGRVPDLQVLTDTNRALFSDVFVKEDPLIHNKNYGVIQNPNVRRRSGKRPANIGVPVPKAQPTAAPAIKPTGSTKPTAIKEEASRPSSRDSTSTQDSKKPNLKRDGSNLFKAFAKQSAKPKLDHKDTNASAASGSVAEADTKMLENEDEGESEDDAVFIDTKTRKEGKKRASDVTKEREERQAKLRKMMEDDEAEAKAVPSVDEAAGLKSEASAEKGDADDDGDVAWSESDSEAKAKKGHVEKEPAQSTRRRGRRKVMKKRQTKDEDGYLVTREEEVWESFSEDESSKTQPKPKPAPPKSQPKSSAASTAKSGGAPAAKKKGDIMSFFGKK